MWLPDAHNHINPNITSVAQAQLPAFSRYGILARSVPIGAISCVVLGRGIAMASKKGNRIVIKLKSTESGHTYTTEKNRRNDPSRLELRKYDPIVRRHVLYRETK